MKRRRVILGVLIAVAACAPARPASRPAAPGPSAPSPSAAAVWSRLTSTEAGVSFEFPRATKDVHYTFGDAMNHESGPYEGKAFDWFATTTADGCSGTFAGGVSRDFSEGTELWVTHIYRWYRQGSRYLIDLRNDRPIAVEPIRELRVDGAAALIFPMPDFFGPVDPANPERVAVVNLPPGHSTHFLAVDLYFCGPDTAPETIERTILSMRFPPASR